MDSQKGFNVMLLIDNGTEATFIFHRLGLLAAYNPAIKHWFADALLDHFAVGCRSVTLSLVHVTDDWVFDWTDAGVQCGVLDFCSIPR